MGSLIPCFGLLVTSALSFKAWGGSLLHAFLLVWSSHLWCNTCWLYWGQHGSWAFLIHILADVSTSTVGGSRLKPMTTTFTSVSLYSTKLTQGQGHLKIKVKLKEINFLSVVKVFMINVLCRWYAFDWKTFLFKKFWVQCPSFCHMSNFWASR